MRSRLAALLVLPLLLSACSMKIKRHEWPATSMEEHERLMWKSVQEGNWDDVERHMSESFLGAYPDGVRDRAAQIAHLRQLKLAEFSLGDFQTQPNGGDMVVAYTAVLRGTVNGTPLPASPMRVISVWQTVRGGWIQIAQAAVPPQPAAGQ